MDFDSYREIMDALVRNKSRSLLTGFGIFWGIFMLLALMGGGQGVKTMLMSNFEGFANNAIIIASERTSMPYKGYPERRWWSLTTSDVEYYRTMVPELDVITPSSSQWNQTVNRGLNSYTGGVVKGVYSDYVKVETPKIKYGRYISETDCRLQRKVCVIGREIYDFLFPDGGDPCGEYVEVGGIYYQVVGVDYGGSEGISINGGGSETVIIPMTVAQKIFRRGNRVDLICMTVKPGVNSRLLEDRIRRITARKHIFSPDDKQAMIYADTSQVFSIVDNVFRGVDFLILLVGIGTILAGAIGVSNIMMVTVKERTVEIGIRRAIGATPSQILSQIIMESVTLTMVAGSAGIVFSVLVLEAAEKIVRGPVTFQIDFWTAVLAALLLTLLGVAAGLAPANRAMKIKPVDAIRDE